MGKSLSKLSPKKNKGKTSSTPAAQEEIGGGELPLRIKELSSQISLPSFPLLNLLVYAHSVTGRRSTNEDTHKSTRSLGSHPNYALCAVYDGHNGDVASVHCYKHFEDVLDANLLKVTQTHLGMHSTSELLYALIATFVDVDDSFLASKLDGGCTACVLLIDRAHRRLLVANCGDSRAVMHTANGGVVVLSRDHKATDEEERSRITNAKHFVTDEGRVDDVLACSRAIGDHMLKVKDMGLPADKRAISSMPSCQCVHVDFGLDEKQAVELASLRQSMETYEPELTEMLTRVSAARTESLKFPRRRSEMERKDETGDAVVHSTWTFPLSESDWPPAVTVTSVSSPSSSSSASVPETDTKSTSSSSLFPFIVVACDGLWDVMSNEEVCVFINQKLLDIVSFDAKKMKSDKPLSWRSVNTISKQLCARAVELGSTDNVTAVLVLLEPNAALRCPS